MKKLLLAVFAGILSVPALADVAVENPANTDANKPVLENPQGRPGDFKEARKKHEAQIKATQEKMKKLVEEYTKLKPGKKKEAKKAEIAQVVAEIRDKQIEFKEKHLADFEKRVAQMKAELAQQNTAEAKKEWVDNRTEALIEQKGDMRALFDMPNPMMDKKGLPGKQHQKFGKPGHPGPKHPGVKPGEQFPEKMGKGPKPDFDPQGVPPFPEELPTK